MQRDIALLAPESVPAAEILSIIRKSCSDILEDAEVFDVYSGGQIPAGKKSVAVNMTFRDLNRTLKDEEVNEEIKTVLENLSGRNIILR